MPGRTFDPDQLILGDYNLSFRVEDRAFQVTINGEEMTGTFSSAKGGWGRLVGLVSRPLTAVGP